MFRIFLRRGYLWAAMACTFLQTSYTRSRRYANYRSGRKYAPAGKHRLDKGTADPAKAEPASIC